MCFRDVKKATTDPAAGQGTFCDGVNNTVPAGDPVKVDPDDGAIQIKRAAGSSSTELLDVHAFLRMLSGGGSELIAAKVDITDVPEIVQGTFPSGPDKGDLDMGGYTSAGGKKGLGAVSAEGGNLRPRVGRLRTGSAVRATPEHRPRVRHADAHTRGVCDLQAAVRVGGAEER